MSKHIHKHKTVHVSKVKREKGHATSSAGTKRVVLQVPELGKLSGLLENKLEFELVSKDEEKKEAPRIKLREFLGPLIFKGAGLGFDRWSGYLYAATNITYNANPGKYLQTFNTNATQPVTSIGAAAEFSTLDALYDECFVHAMELEFVPRNSYNTSPYATGDGDFKNAGTCAAVVVALQHNATPYSDNASAWINMRSQKIHKVVDLAKRWRVTWVNNERFDWGAPLGDQTTSASTQGWCQNGLVTTKYGGFFQIATPIATGASLGIGALLESQIPGDITIRFYLSMRARG